MDHLPIPDHCLERQVKVPHRNLVSYDKLGFVGFLERLGYEDVSILKMLRNQDELPRAESIIQESLYFGTLHLLFDTFGVPIDLDRFINIDAEGVRTVTSQPLSEYFESIVAKKTELTDEQHDELQKAINQTAVALTAITSSFNTWYVHLNSAIMFSIFILLETLYETVRLHSKQATHISTGFMMPSPGIHFGEKMRENGWCLASIQGVLHGNTSVAYFASLLPSYNTEDHLTCTWSKCFKVHKKVENVTCQHADLTCPGREKCNDIFIKQSDLTEILDLGSFPAVMLRDADGQPHLEVVDAKKHDFVAISHVWAHGLGNPHANSMPQCQIRRLFSLISQIATPSQRIPALWIDTLCVPVSSKHYRKLSISRLRHTYKQATKVLILDNRLLRVQSTNVCEAVCNLLCCDWMSRLWTLQEGLLPKLEELYVQFDDHAIPMISLCRDESAGPMSHIVENKLRGYLSSRFLKHDPYGGLKDGESLSDRPYTKLLAVMRDLHNRRTTKAEDEPVCIATLMNIDLATFEELPSMEDIYHSISQLPRSLIFASGPRLTTPGFRWAPSTFLEQPIDSFRIPGGMAVLGLLTSKGFDLMAYSVTLLDPLTIRQHGPAFVIEFPGGKRSSFSFLPDFNFYPDCESLFIKSPAIIMDGPPRNGAVVVEVTDATRYGRSMCGSYRLPGYIVPDSRLSSPTFQDPFFETVRGDFPLQLNWYVD